MLTEEKREEIRTMIAEHATKPETISSSALEKEFRDRINKMIEGRGAEQTLWTLAALFNDKSRQSFVGAFDKVGVHGFDPATGRLTK